MTDFPLPPRVYVGFMARDLAGPSKSDARLAVNLAYGL